MALIKYFDTLVMQPWIIFVSLVAVLAVFHLLWTAFAPGLRSLPGPFLAKFTDAWRLLKVWRGDYEKTTICLHEKYGDVVRVGPNMISIADPAAIESIYGVKTNFPKVRPDEVLYSVRTAPLIGARVNFTTYLSN